MEIRIKCSGCGKGYRLPARVAGKSFKCKGCGDKVRVPAAKPAERVELIEVEPVQAQPVEVEPVFEMGGGFDPQRRTGPSMNPKLLWRAGAAFTVLVVLCVGAWVLAGMFGGEQAATNPDPAAVSHGDVSTPAHRGRQTGNDRSRLRPGHEQTALERQRAFERRRRLAEQEQADARSGVQPPPTVQPLPPPPASRIWAHTYVPEEPVRVSASPPEPVAPIGEWLAQADPPDPAAAFQPDAGMQKNINHMEMRDIQRPATPSPYLLVGENSIRTHKRVVINLRNGRIAWVLDGKRPGLLRPALSPNGRMIALHGVDGDQHGIFIYAENRRRRAVVIELPTDPTSSRLVEFISNETLLLLDGLEGGRPCGLMAYNPETGEEKWRSEEIERSGGGQVYAISPGGRYLALPIRRTGESSHVLFVDLTDGQVVGRANVGDPRTRDCLGVCFSPDGSRCAAFFGEGRGYVAVWDMTTGDLRYWRGVGANRQGQALRRYTKFALCMLDNDRIVSDGQSWVYDALSGRMIGGYPSSRAHPNQAFRRSLHDGYFLMLEKAANNRGGFGGPNWLRIHRLNVDRLYEAIVSIDTGGGASEVGLPLLQDTFLSHGEQGFVVPPNTPSPFPLEWPDPVEPVALTDHPIDLPRRTNAAGPSHLGARITLSPTSHGGMALATNNWSGDHYLIDLTGRARPVAIELPGSEYPLSVTPDGSQALFRFGGARLGLVDLATMEVVSHWRLRSKDQGGHSIREAVRVGDDRLWVLESSGTVSVIDTASNRLQMTGHQITTSLEEMTADQRYLLCVNARAPGRGDLLMLDTRTGQAVAKLDLGGGQAVDCSVCPHGPWVASLVINEHDTRFLVVHDLRTGERVSRNALPMRLLTNDQGRKTGARRHGSVLGWRDDAFVVMSGAGTHYEVVHARTGRLAWSYNIDLLLTHALVRPFSYGGIPSYFSMYRQQALWAYRLQRGDRPTQVAPLILPHPEAEAVIAQQDWAQPVELVVRPGMRVRVEIAGGVRHGSEIRENLEDALGQAGFDVTDNADVVLRVLMYSEPRNLEVHVSAEPLRLSRQLDFFVCTWVVPEYGVAWIGRQVFGTPNVSLAEIRRAFPDLEIQAAHDRYQQEFSPRSLDFSRVVPVPATYQLLGRTLVTEDGYQAIPSDQE